jgi:hypothetical protein
MRQAIEEGFIQDVLANYTCYERYYELVRTAEDDPDTTWKVILKLLPNKAFRRWRFWV